MIASSHNASSAIAQLWDDPIVDNDPIEAAVKQAEQQAKQLIDVLAAEPPVDVYAVAKHLGIDVKSAPLQPEWRKGGSIYLPGMSCGQEERQYIAEQIKWNIDLVGHQLGVANPEYDSVGQMAFGYELLLPEAWVRNTYKATPELHDMAQIFDVSLDMMAFRLAWLKLQLTENYV